MSARTKRTGAAILLALCAAIARAGDEEILYHYDDAGRLTAAVYGWGGTNAAVGFELDAAGNCTNRLSIGRHDTATDADGDGMPDLAELFWFGHRRETPAGDADGDGFINRDELAAKTSPADPDSFLGLTQTRAPSGGRVVQWSSVNGLFYSVDRSTNLLAGSWQSISNNVPGVAPVNVVTDTTAVGKGPWLYRIGVE